MPRETYHPNANLSKIRNVKRGLKARTRIITVLEKNSTEAGTIAREAGMHYKIVTHHLKLLKNEGIVGRKSGRPQVWMLTGAGQKRLVSSV
jgi:predicted transcriptional regulator